MREREGRTLRRAAPTGEGTDHTGQHLPPLPATGARHPATGWRTAPLQHVGQAHTDRLGWIPGILTDWHPQVARGRLRISQPHRRQQALLHTRERDGHGAHHRRRHHDGPRRMSPGRERLPVCQEVAGAHPPLAGPLPEAIQQDAAPLRPPPGTVSHCAGLQVQGPAAGIGKIRGRQGCRG